MSRRPSLTAIATAALAVSLAAVTLAPTAIASPLPLPLPSFLEQEDRLIVTVANTGVARADGTYELSCAPAGGTHADARSACARLDEIAAEGGDPFAPVPEGQMCTMQMGGPATARITGTWQGRNIDATFSHKNGCEISRWQNLVPVLPSARG
ncbi:subtilase-type protease inhibitor [Streptomyces sp. NBC_01498]|uniref:SSI family serine proteinase inhibitor n=1 Tax=Streptomyces sp. NBC_01498 TaxID=2975870 RepID=UPI002E7ADB9F|nr:SSI family serine proteinase inhibitor [Streptomyces sp. NBC_01498]WTL25971.1 subtilase-type protease inhibitor [Streptomyces sp. NBC_01498]